MFRNEGSPLDYLAAFATSFALGFAICLLGAYYGRYMSQSGRKQAFQSVGGTFEALGEEIQREV